MGLATTNATVATADVVRCKLVGRVRHLFAIDRAPEGNLRRRRSKLRTELWAKELRSIKRISLRVGRPLFAGTPAVHAHHAALHAEAAVHARLLLKAAVSAEAHLGTVRLGTERLGTVRGELGTLGSETLATPECGAGGHVRRRSIRSSVEKVVGRASLGNTALRSFEHEARSAVSGEAHVGVAAEVARVLSAAISRGVTHDRFPLVAVVVDPGRTASTNHATATLASTGVVIGTVLVGVGVGAQISTNGAHATDNARLLGEVAARCHAARIDVELIALSQPRADGLLVHLGISGRVGIDLGLGQGGDARLASRVILAMAGPAADTRVGVGLTVLGADGVCGASSSEREQDVDTAAVGTVGTVLQRQSAVGGAAAFAVED
jgi:hypothetical protein